jgi:iron(III) transport system ATP-binding protein
MVTHDQEEALAMADRIVVMNNGHIEQVGGPEEIYREPETAFVSDFVGHMTFLDAVVLEHGRVKVGLLELVVANSRGFPPGSNVKLAMRPEEVRTRNIDVQTTNAFDARVASLSFLGAFCRAILNPVNSPDTSIAVDFSTNAMRDLGISVGQTRVVAFPAEALRIFPREDGELSR